MYPTLPIPQPEQDLLDLLDMPDKIKSNTERPLAQVKAVFPLETIIKTNKADLFKKLRQIPSAAGGATADQTNAAVANQTGSDDALTVLEIGTLTPAENFLELLRRGERFATLCLQIQSVVADLAFKSVVMQDEKLLKAIVVYRLQAIELGAYRYNEWIVEFKETLLNRNKLSVWQTIIVAERLGLITSAESEISTVTDEESRAFYVSAVADAAASSAVPDDDADMDDLLGNM